jgi:hypothetical protein
MEKILSMHVLLKVKSNLSTPQNHLSSLLRCGVGKLDLNNLSQQTFDPVFCVCLPPIHLRVSSLIEAIIRMKINVLSTSLVFRNG